MDYIQTGVIYINNGVIFDEEQKIQNELNTFESQYLNTLNCSFINSKSSIGLQLSDAIVGFAARLLKYICDIPNNSMNDLINKFHQNHTMKDNLCKFWELYNRSDHFYKYSICNKISLFDLRLVNSFFNTIASYKNDD